MEELHTFEELKAYLVSNLKLKNDGTNNFIDLISNIYVGRDLFIDWDYCKAKHRPYKLFGSHYSCFGDSFDIEFLKLSESQGKLRVHLLVAIDDSDYKSSVIDEFDKDGNYVGTIDISIQ